MRTSLLIGLPLLLLAVSCGSGSPVAPPATASKAPNATKAPTSPVDKVGVEIGELYSLILAKHADPKNSSVKFEQAEWSKDEGIQRVLVGFKASSSMSIPGKLRPATVAVIERAGFDVVSGKELTDATRKIFDGQEWRLWSFSPPVAAREGKVLVFGLMWCGSLCADGSIYVFEKKSKGWELVNQRLLWVS